NFTILRPRCGALILRPSMFTIDLFSGHNGDYDKYMIKTFNTVKSNHLKFHRAMLPLSYSLLDQAIHTKEG
ncbi:hypothetical protein, partial [Prevotella nigrescens]|uniref:hypothetical protein n=1 Tax=Prevotella nigrescens TaxID=28133 RepID=UPI0036070B7C